MSVYDQILATIKKDLRQELSITTLTCKNKKIWNLKKSRRHRMWLRLNKTLTQKNRVLKIYLRLRLKNKIRLMMEKRPKKENNKRRKSQKRNKRKRQRRRMSNQVQNQKYHTGNMLACIGTKQHQLNASWLLESSLPLSEDLFSHVTGSYSGQWPRCMILRSIKNWGMSTWSNS